MRITAQDMLGFHIIDRILPEPVGGAHRDPTAMAITLRDALVEELAGLSGLGTTELVESRYHRYRTLGDVREDA
jgi:acetyl-CoA carboxylase carboxyl transferase subunit alpha